MCMNRNILCISAGVCGFVRGGVALRVFFCLVYFLHIEVLYPKYLGILIML